ncbi:MAG: ribbon-helix-helix domain-containing protein [Alphaproteobacteria bacterium]|nr:ribbon-helix-helix domain-containing protein [Alphaproteobacteria bacterium]
MLKQSEKQTVMFSARIPASLDKRMNDLAERTHRSKAYIVRKALEQYLEDKEDLAELFAAFEDSVQKQEKGYTLEEMKKRYNIDV